MSKRYKVKRFSSCYLMNWVDNKTNKELTALEIEEILHKQEKRIAELEQQLEEKEKEIRQLDNEKGMLLNNSMKLLKEKDDRLKSQPAEIVEKINGEIYTRMVVVCKETKYTDINLILNTILKEYQK